MFHTCLYKIGMNVYIFVKMYTYFIQICIFFNSNRLSNKHPLKM